MPADYPRLRKRVWVWGLQGGLRAAGLLGSFGLFFALVRLGGPEAFGRYAYWSSWALALAPIATGGCFHGVIRLVSRYRARNRDLEEAAVLRWSLSRVFCSLLVVSTVGSLGLWLLTPLDGYGAVVWVALLAGLVLLALASAAWQGRGQVSASLAAFVVVRPVVVAGTGLGLVYLFSQQWADLALLELDAGLSLGFGLILLIMACWRRVGSVADNRQLRLWNKAANGYVVVTGMSGLAAYGSILLAGTMLNDFEIGAFTAAVKLTTLVSFPLMVVNSMVTHRISHLRTVGDHAGMARMLGLTTLYSSMAALAITASMIFLAPWLMGLFHPDYRAAVMAVWVMAIGQLCNVGFGSVGWYLNMTGRQGVVVRIYVINAVVLCVSGLILIPLYGVVGAAWAATLQMTSQNLLSWLWIRTRDSIDTSAVGGIGALRRR